MLKHVATTPPPTGFPPTGDMGDLGVRGDVDAAPISSSLLLTTTSLIPDHALCTDLRTCASGDSSVGVGVGAVSSMLVTSRRRSSLGRRRRRRGVACDAEVQAW